MSVSESAFREAMSSFATGVTVVTSPPVADMPAMGVTINSFSSVSLKPPLVLWCLERTADTFLSFRRATMFAVNILCADQEPLSIRFSVSGDHTLRGIGHEVARSGAPLIEGALAHVECRKTAEYDGGDHVIFLGEVMSVRTRRGNPLLYYRSTYQGLDGGSHR